ncbi:unnamed protein product [Paramecium pentaurelia]|uniref:Uncharacterized protein n=1 Tax=Paramecium pentaurelia TaxID=43138 RepID=A0A8S1V041_9CILI|nr:unnamed protein product [Paramecium pentaurelia]
MKVQIEDVCFDLDPKFKDHSELLNQLYDPTSNEPIQLQSKYVNKEIWKIIEHYYVLNNFKPVQTEVNCDDENKVFTPQDLEILRIIKNSNISIHRFLLAARYLNLPSFQDLLVSKLATEFYVDVTKPKQSLENLCKKYPQVPVVTKEEIKQYNQVLQYLI